MDTTIAFIGGGNMARSLIGGLVAAGHNSQAIWAADPLPELLQQLQNDFNINTTAANHTAVTAADVVVLAVKPQLLHEVASGLASAVQARQPLVISIAAGIREPDMALWLGGEPAIVRCMPNTPALLRCGATALYANSRVSVAQRQLAETIMQAAGITVWVDEEILLDSVTALSGSGPAYFFLVMEAMEQAGQAMGLTSEQARNLTLQTALGAARMAVESNESAATLRQRVTSPGGTTERAIGILQDQGLEDLFMQALQGAKQRCQELSDQLGGTT